VAQRPADYRPRYLRTYRRKLGEGFDLAGKAMTATAAASTLSLLATKGVSRFPSPSVGVTIAVGLATILVGIHLQAEAKPDE